ncbi:MAG: ATP-binding protein [Kineosporiaceae bacterium]|nr:ATP-binding protein [Kineosporiaceae bacterium]
MSAEPGLSPARLELPVDALAASEHLGSRLGLIETRVRTLVDQRRQDDPAVEDPFRGLYLSEEDVDRLLTSSESAPASLDGLLPVEQAQDECEAAGRASRLRRLQRTAALTALDVEFLLIALAPDLDGRLERLYGWLNDDVTRRRATPGLALALCGVPTSAASARARLAPSGALVRHGLVVVEEADRPFLGRALRVPDRVTSHLLGDDTPDASVADVLATMPPLPGAESDRLTHQLQRGVRLVYLHDRGRLTGTALAVAAVEAAGRRPVVVDLAQLATAADREQLLTLAGREALLQDGALIAGPIEALAEAGAALVRRLAALPVPVVVTGQSTWDPRWSGHVPLLVSAPILAPHERERLWRAALGPDRDVVVPVHLHLGPDQIDRAVTAARLAADLAGTPIGENDLQAGARSQNTAGLERLTHRIEPMVGWVDLVLPDAVHGQLRELAARARHRDQVLGTWKMRPGGGRGRGVTALFAGDSGTGKTMSAEVIAAELGLDLYQVDLATVVDKYVGETEKNLERIFSEAAGVNAVLLFDEADAVFGKRSEVRDAHDRYANVESAFLLQRMESFDGLAVLSTNLRANIDEAFTRRLDVIIDFPAPDETSRRALWHRCLTAPLPIGEDVDLDFCARAFELTGGNIRSVAVTAAYRCAASGRPVSMADVITAVQQEYRKLGRLVLREEFGTHLPRS